MQRNYGAPNGSLLSLSKVDLLKYNAQKPYVSACKTVPVSVAKTLSRGHLDQAFTRFETIVLRLTSTLFYHGDSRYMMSSDFRNGH